MAYVLDHIENDLLVCLCEALAEEGRPVCDCFAYPGGERPPMDTCGRDGIRSGQAWLSRLEGTWQPDVDRQTWSGGLCGGRPWLVSLELGVYRCSLAVPDETAMIDKSLYALDRELLNADTQTLLRAVLCCPVWDEFSQMTVVSSALERMAPEGGCMGVVLRLIISGDVASVVDEVALPDEVDEGMVWVSGPAG